MIIYRRKTWMTDMVIQFWSGSRNKNSL